jgi:hypothetical protein
MKSITNFTCFIAIAAFVAGCVTPQRQLTTPQAAVPQPTVPFDESALLPFAGKGTSTITGQAFLKTAGGEVRYGAGDNVLLIPVTPYTTQEVGWADSTLIIAGVPTPTSQNMFDLRLQKYIRTVVGDGSGNFEFQNIPAGDYYVLCPIIWSVPNYELGIIDKTGGVAHAKTHVDDGETVKVVVTLQ